MRKALVILLAVPALVAGGAITAPAQAATPTITLYASASTVTPGTAVKFTGRATGGTYKLNQVKLQRKNATSWSNVSTGKLTSTKTYSFKLSPPSGKTTYRVVGTLKTGRVVSSPLRAITVKTVTPPVVDNLDQIRAMILSQTNQARANNGRPPLILMPELNTVAQNWTVKMATNQSMVHNLYFFDQYPANAQAGAENIASGQSPEAVVAAWMASEGHRANMLDGYTHIGIGFARDVNGRTYFTQNFGYFE